MIDISWKDDYYDRAFPAIYKIYIGEHIYIGSTKRNAKSRISEHIRLLKQNKHYNHKMQDWFNEIKIASFYVIEYPKLDEVIEREQFWINKLKPDINIIQNVANY